MIIQKFGGVAVKDQAMRLNCINHIKNGLKEFGDVVVVVSAIGRYGDPYSTDSLLQLTDAFSSSTAASDLAASCGELIAAAVLSAELERAGIVNTVLHGAQAGIMTAGDFGDGTITRIDTSSIIKSLERTHCVIIPGFQGVAENGQVMTLGRGGSDLSAIALAGALHASHAEFFKDVPGVMTHDPREVENPRKHDVLKLKEFIPLLDCDRPIIQKRAALHALKTATPLYIRGIAGTETGTWVTP
ncbi:aspartate kinase [Sporosarcina sp. JAI121]|uniref:amino acid kinase family protein n=1 Tax=Sporosarcina sp. JAI121 TaxID=2723064 RepID=UPI0015CD76D7|nr:aspartate kinase [Sporosarcina sp. JAI121]NYF24113.1 aspartate kinase [Sporosarcina sp. JAI121]